VRGGIGDPELDDGAIAAVVPGRSGMGLNLRPSGYEPDERRLRVQLRQPAGPLAIR